MTPEDIARQGVEFGNLAGERLHSLLSGQLPTPQEYMAFYGAAGGTVIGNAMAEIVRHAGKEIGAQWLMEVLGIIQMTARRNGADIILAGGISLKSMATAKPAPAQPAPSALPEKALESNICPCEIQAGTCWTCERELERTIDKFAGLLKGLVVETAPATENAKLCQVCKVKMVDGLLAVAVKKYAPSFTDRLGPAIEIFLAVVLPQLRSAMPEVAWTKTEAAVSAQVEALPKPPGA